MAKERSGEFAAAQIGQIMPHAPTAFEISVPKIVMLPKGYSIVVECFAVYLGLCTLITG